MARRSITDPTAEPLPTQPVRIVFVIDQLSLGGAEHHLVRLLTGLAQSGRWLPSLYCLGRVGELIPGLEAAEIEVAGPERPYRRSLLGTTRAWLDLWRYLKSERPVITHSYLAEPGFLGSLASRLAGVPYVLTTRRQVHGYRGPKLLQYRITTWVSDLCSSSVITVCDAARRQAMAEGTPPHKLVTVLNAVEPRTSEKVERFFPGSPVIGSIGRLEAYKGYEYLLRAAPAVIAELPEARFAIVGDGAERSRLESLAADLGVGDRVTFLGQRVGASAFLSQFDVFVLPSLLEGLPNVVLEAMAAGLPIVATSVGGVPEMVDDQRTGLLIDPSSSDSLARALIRVWRDHALRRRLATEAQQAAARDFSPERELEETEAVYLRLLNRGK